MCEYLTQLETELCLVQQRLRRGAYFLQVAARVSSSVSGKVTTVKGTTQYNGVKDGVKIVLDSRDCKERESGQFFGGFFFWFLDSPALLWNLCLSPIYIFGLILLLSLRSEVVILLVRVVVS